MGTIYTELQPLVPGTAWTGYVSLVSIADTDTFKTTVTLAAGDVTLSKDGAAPANLTTLPSETGVTGIITVALSAAETTGITKFAVIRFHDAAGDEWQDLLVIIPATSAVSVSSATEVWAAASRTLTQSAAAVTAAVSGSTLTITRGATYSATISGLTISATWDEIYLTVKEFVDHIESESVLQIKETATPAVTDGITYLDKTAATVTTRAYGSLTVNQSAGTIVIAITDDGTLLIPSGVYSYDIKEVLADGSSNVLSASATCRVQYTETHTV